MLLHVHDSNMLLHVHSIIVITCTGYMLLHVQDSIICYYMYRIV